MNTSHPIPAGKSSRAPSVAHILLWAWLVGLTALVLVAFQVTGDLAGQSQLDSSAQRLQALESRVAEIADANRVLQERPAPATAAALQELRQTLDSRAAQLDQSLATRAAQEDLIALGLLTLSKSECARQQLGATQRANPALCCRRQQSPSKFSCPSA